MSQLNLSAAPGSQLSFSTYLGGNYEEEGRGIARGSDGTLYVTGVSFSTAPSGSQSDAFVSALDLSSLTTPAPYDESYAYDQLGNLTNKAGVAYLYGTNLNGTGTGPHQARVVGVQNYSYDANGNLLSGGGRTLTWDIENRPSSVTSGGVTETYAYDADGERVSVTRSGVTTLYLEGVWEEVVGGASKTHYLLGGQLVAVRANGAGTLSYLHSDHLGSVGLVTGWSGSAPVVQSQQHFAPWGSLRAGSVTQTSLNYTGQRLDGTGLLYYHARYYDPQLARFISADTVVPGNASDGMEGIAVKPLTIDFHEGGFLDRLNKESKLGFWFQLSDDEKEQAGSPWGPANPQALNRYAYVQNNPLRYTDPSGHWTISISFGGALFAAIGVRVDFINVSFDGYGNVGVFVSGGGGGYAGGGGNIGPSGTWTPAPSISDLKGWSAQVGGAVGEAVGPTAELVFFNSNGVGYVGVDVGGGAMLLAPMPFEVHGTVTYTVPLVSCNVFTKSCGLGDSGVKTSSNAAPPKKGSLPPKKSKI